MIRVEQPKRRALGGRNNKLATVTQGCRLICVRALFDHKPLNLSHTFLSEAIEGPIRLADGLSPSSPNAKICDSGPCGQMDTITYSVQLATNEMA